MTICEYLMFPVTFTLSHQYPSHRHSPSQPTPITSRLLDCIPTLPYNKRTIFTLRVATFNF